MRRLVILAVLVVAVVANAVAVVYMKHERRALFIQLNRLEHRRDAMLVEWGQLQLEQSTWGAQERVQALASSKLGMHLPRASDIVVVVR